MYQAQSFDHLEGLDRISDGQLAEHLDFGLAEGTRRLAYEYDGMVLHELYFSNLKPGGAPRPSDRQACGGALAQTYGSIDQWQESFKALGGMRGVGWVILFQDPLTGRLTNFWVSLHQDGIPARCAPLLVMDVWEHAFMRDYRATERLRYVEAFFANIDWATVVLGGVRQEAGGGDGPLHRPIRPASRARRRRR